jgi:hypothetical protein
MVIKYPKHPSNIPNGHKIYKHFPIEGPPKFSQSGIFGLKTNHLATLVAHIHVAIVAPCLGILQGFQKHYLPT